MKIERVKREPEYVRVENVKYGTCVQLCDGDLAIVTAFPCERNQVMVAVLDTGSGRTLPWGTLVTEHPQAKVVV